MVRIGGFLRERFDKRTFTGRILTVLVISFLILLLTFLGITDQVVNSEALTKIDARFAQFLFTIRTNFLTNFFYIVTQFGNLGTTTLIAASILLYFLLKQKRYFILGFVITLLGTEATIYFLKIIINRARPGADIAYYLETSKSFPSAHAGIALALYGFLAYYLIVQIKKRPLKRLLVFFSILLIILIGFSRLYLGVHFLSDVIGGYILGSLWLLASIGILEEHSYELLEKKLT